MIVAGAPAPVTRRDDVPVHAVAPASAPAGTAAPRARRAASGDGPRRLPGGVVLAGLVLLLVALTICAIGHGAFHIAPLDVLRIVAGNLGIDAGAVDSRQVAVLNSIRLPRRSSALHFRARGGTATPGFTTPKRRSCPICAAPN